MKTRIWFALTLAVGFLAALLVAAGGGPPRPAHAGQAPPPAVMGPLSLANSTITTENCYQEDKTQTLCFQIFNGSPDGEWLDRVQLTFPTIGGNWVVACNPALQDPTDSVGYSVDLACTTPMVNQVVYTDNDSDGFGEISSGASWGTCLDVTVPAGYDDDRYIPWELSGDQSNTISGSLRIEKCTPLTLKPSHVTIEGCNGLTQTLEFKLENYSAGDVDVDLTYVAPEADFTGLTNLHINQGDIVTFTTELKPRLWIKPGEEIVAGLTVEVQGGGHADTSVLTQTITENSGWRRRDDSPIPTMDNAVIWANHADGSHPSDGGLWSVGGYGSGGAAQRYDPATGAWLTYTNPLTPVIEYPMDGCYGLNGGGDEIVVLFPDTIVTGTLQIFNITQRNWYTEPVPAPGYPAKGRWGQDIVSMLQHTGENVCYLSGGATQTGGGRTRDLWKYHPGTNAAEYINQFPADVWFGFHASWYVPWVGDGGAICVAGGVDHNHQINDSTQCYDIDAGTFNILNADLGTLPEPWWGMADGWQVTGNGYELWIANGVAQDGTLLPASAYIREGMSDFEYGPEIPQGLYRLEGDAWEDQFYTLNGSQGGFWYGNHSLHLAPCPACHSVYLPMVLRE